MHPNTFLRTFWRTEIRPEIFVAMSFGDAFAKRFSDVIEPAIQSVTFNAKPLRAVRVDLSRTGDSILTDIIDGIAHSVLVLADVSVIGRDSKTGVSYRNGNVMYEVGLALASRHPSEVLLVRDDKEPFLFDVSTVPHKHIDFEGTETARLTLSEEITSRLREIEHVSDARIAIAAATLTDVEQKMLSQFSKYDRNMRFWLTSNPLATSMVIPRLLDKQLIRTDGRTEEGRAMFRWTELGYLLAKDLSNRLPTKTREDLASGIRSDDSGKTK